MISSLKKVFSAYLDFERSGRSILAGLGFLTALEGVILSASLAKNFSGQGRLAAGFNFRQMVVLAACTIMIACLVWVGLTLMRRPQLSLKWLVCLSKPAVLRGAAYPLFFLILALWVIVFGWKGRLDQVWPLYSLLYERYFPLFLWALLSSVQAGLFLWLTWQYKIAIPGESEGASRTQGRRNWLLEIAAGLFALCLYFFILRIQIPRPVSSIFRYDLIFFSIPVLFSLYFGFRHPGWIGNLIGLSVVLVLAGFALACLWNSGISEEPIIMGLLPYKDSANYYTEAQLLLNGLPIQSFGGRPLFSLFLAVLLRLSGSNLQAAIAMMAAITIICCYAAAREVNRNFGAAPAALTMLLLFIYYRQMIGSTLTENLGLAFGALSLVFLLQGARLRNYWISVFGLFMASLAMNVRPGPLLALPCLILWFAIKFRRANALRSALLPLLISCAVVLLPFMLNMLMIKSLAVPETAMFSRFPHTLYGLAVGGKSWGQIYLDHHFVTDLPQDQQNAAIYGYAFQEMRTNPGLFLYGVGKFLTDFFTPQYGAFNFIRFVLPIRAGLFGLSLFGIGYLIKKYRSPGSLLILACLAGICLSSPFVPTRDSDYMRTYAAAAPFIVAIPSISLSWLCLRSKTDPEDAQADQPHMNPFRSASFVLSALFVACVIVGPFVVRFIAQKPGILSTGCPANETAFNIRINQGSYIRIIADDTAHLSRLPDLRMSDLVFSVNDFSYRDAFAHEPYQPGMLVLNTLDLLRRDQAWIAVPSAGLPLDGSIVKVCGRKARGSIFVFAQGN